MDSDIKVTTDITIQFQRSYQVFTSMETRFNSKLKEN